MTRAAPQLREDLEILSGMDDHPLIFDPVSGVYHRISRSGRALIGHFDGRRTTEDLVTIMPRASTEEAERSRHQLESFLAQLEASGLLAGSTPVRPARRRASTSRLMPRMVVSTALPGLLEPVAAGLRRAPLRALAAVAGTGAVAGFVLGLLTLLSAGRAGEHILGWPVAVAVGLQLLLILLHETAHALVAQITRAPVRGLGVALLFWVLPVAYVDRTDAYRLKGRGPRIAIALAGIGSDGWFCGATGLVALGSGGAVRQTALALLGIQLLALAVNLNPLMPSDGFTAVETASGLVDLRGRSFAMLKWLGLRRPLPDYIRSLPVPARLGYAAYGTLAAGYVGLVVLIVAGSALRSVGTLVAGLAA